MHSEHCSTHTHSQIEALPRRGEAALLDGWDEEGWAVTVRRPRPSRHDVTGRPMRLLASRAAVLAAAAAPPFRFSENSVTRSWQRARARGAESERGRKSERAREDYGVAGDCAAWRPACHSVSQCLQSRKGWPAASAHTSATPRPTRPCTGRRNTLVRCGGFCCCGVMWPTTILSVNGEFEV